MRDIDSNICAQYNGICMVLALGAREKEIFAMYNYIPHDLNPLLDIGVDQWPKSAYWTFASGSIVLVKLPFC